MQIAMRDAKGILDPEWEKLMHKADGEKLRDEAIDRVEKNAEPGWMDRGMVSLGSLCSQGVMDQFTASEFLRWTRVWDRLPEPREPRVLGALFRKAHRDGLIEPTNEFRPSIEPLAHHRPSRVWKVKR